MNKKVRWITETAVMLALLVALQALTKGFGQFVTGSCVNAVLAVTVLTAGLGSGIVVAVLSPVLAYLLGIAPQILVLPAIMVGNTVFVVLLRLIAGTDSRKVGQQIAAWLIAALAKFAVLYLIVVKVVCGVMAPSLLAAGTLKEPMLKALPATFSWPQLVTALIGGGVYGILLLVRGSGGKVKVYPIMEFCTNYADDQAETQGLVKPDKMQSIYVSETQKITKYFVREGDTVKVGDPILSYDTTLTDLQLERARISVQKLEIALDEANANLVKVNNYRLYVPQPDPIPDEEPDTPPLTPVDVPYFRGGDGTKDSPFFYIWSDDCAYDSAFIDSLLKKAGGSTAYVVFEVHDGDSPDGDILRSWGMVFVRQSDGTVAFKVDEAYGRFDDGTAPDDGGDIDDGGNTYIDTTPSYTYNELIAMRREAQEKIYQTELDLKKARLEYETLEFEINNGVVYSKIDGVVKTIRSPDQAREEQLPAVLISGGGGYYVTGAMSETELQTLHVGDTVTVMSWQTYSQTEAEIVSISEYPVGENSGYYHWSQGNNNASLYPFTVYLDEDTPVREGEYVNITYNPFGSSASGVYLQNMFILREGGGSFVYVRDANGKLEKRAVSTGRSLWGSYTQINGGLTGEEYIAFPYGNNIRAGAKTEISDVASFYNY